MFVNIFGADLEAEGVVSGLYLPLKDEEGVLGVLVFEAGKPDFATPVQIEVAAILANQTAVALRNAQLYHQVPMVDALGALTAKKRALLAVPRRKLYLYGAVALALMAASLLVREERLQRIRAGALRQELALLDEDIARTTIRAPISGVVLTPHLHERVGASLEEGDLLLTLGRTDSLELEFGVDQRDVSRVRPGQEVRLRVDALPQRTVAGSVVSVGQLPLDSGSTVRYPVRAAVGNPGGVLKPQMSAYARVLTEPASAVTQFLRTPVRWVRLLWWRLWA
jgi:multidrug efflux pump subunit AcrA (membrane-fusion protein)